MTRDPARRDLAFVYIRGERFIFISDDARHLFAHGTLPNEDRKAIDEGRR